MHFSFILFSLDSMSFFSYFSFGYREKSRVCNSCMNLVFDNIGKGIWALFHRAFHVVFLSWCDFCNTHLSIFLSTAILDSTTSSGSEVEKSFLQPFYFVP